jgi:hypothetical protein
MSLAQREKYLRLCVRLSVQISAKIKPEAVGWIHLLFGGVLVLMGTLIVGVQIGIVPTDESVRFLAPPLIIVSLGYGLMLGGIPLWIPGQTPPILKTFLFLMALSLVAVACNWTAFAPNVVYHSSTSVGPIEISGTSDVRGRIAFGVATLVLDATLISTLLAWVRSAYHGSCGHRWASKSIKPDR